MKKITIMLMLLMATCCFADSFLNVSFTTEVDFPKEDLSQFDSVNLGLKFMHLGKKDSQKDFNLGYSFGSNVIYSEADYKFILWDQSYDVDCELTQAIVNAQFVPSYKKKVNENSDFYLYGGLGFDFARTELTLKSDGGKGDEHDTSFGLAYSLGMKYAMRSISFDVSYQHLANEIEIEDGEANFAVNSVLFSIGFKL